MHQGNNSKPQHHALFVQDGLTPHPGFLGATVPTQAGAPALHRPGTAQAAVEGESDASSEDFDSEADYDSCSSLDCNEWEVHPTTAAPGNMPVPVCCHTTV